MAEAEGEESRLMLKRGGDKDFNAKVDAMDDEDELQSLLDTTSDPDKRKVVRARLRIVRVKKRELREARLNAGEEAMVHSKMQMAEASKQSELESYSMKYSASSYSKKETTVSYEEN
ncbi:uncharacterized protein [Amphiura filiformis]|uniref:uncharacterized protein n=1 Tax=Amphiura filiformis TaxID=82378 RepID=UPI003B215EBD